MNDINMLFRKRIGLPEDETLDFQSLASLLEKTAMAIPFENFRIIEGRTEDISKTYLMNKICMHDEGGLCYEINPLLYYFLRDNGFDVVLTRGSVFGDTGYSTRRTHAAILLKHQGETYLIDSGFGGNLPLAPVPLNGDTVESTNGLFYVKREDTPYGDYVLMMKRRHKDTEWKIGHAFDARRPIDEAELNEIQKLIMDNPDSSFNKQKMITRLTPNGNITLTENSFTQWVDGTQSKQDIEDHQFADLLNKHYGDFRRNNTASL